MLLHFFGGLEGLETFFVDFEGPGVLFLHGELDVFVDGDGDPEDLLNVLLLGYR